MFKGGTNWFITDALGETGAVYFRKGIEGPPPGTYDSYLPSTGTAYVEAVIG